MRAALIRYSPLLILAVAWQLISHFEFVSSTALPPLTQIGAAWLDLLTSGDLQKNAAPSLYRGGVAAERDGRARLSCPKRRWLIEAGARPFGRTLHAGFPYPAS